LAGLELTTEGRKVNLKGVTFNRIVRVASRLRSVLTNNKRPSTGEDFVPPSELQFVGDGDFVQIGNEFLNHFITLGQLRQNERVLDVGCGVGRMAVPLTQYLTSGGRYEGFDIVEDGILWCQKKVTPHYPNFRFRFVDVRNPAYNPTGSLNPVTFGFPYKDASFDFAFLTSVFTHMLPAEVDHYLSEISRVLKGDGRAFVTFFVLCEESLTSMKAGSSHLDFKYNLGGCRTTNAEIPEAAVAYEEGVLRESFLRRGLTIIEPIHRGAWSGRPDFVSYQDIVLASRTSGSGA